MNNKVYYLWGEDFFIEQEIDNILAKFFSKNELDTEVISLDVDELTSKDLAQQLESASLFSTARIFIIRKPWWFQKNKVKAKKLDEIIQVFKDYVKKDLSEQILIISSNEENKAHALRKEIENSGGQIFACKNFSVQDLQKWIVKRFSDENTEINSRALLLLLKSGQDMYYLQNLIEKLILMELGTIEEDDVKLHLDSRQEIKVFALSDALLERNVQVALSSYFQLLQQGGSELGFLKIITGQFIHLAKVKSLLEAGMGQDEIQNKTGLKAFAVKKLSEKSRKFSQTDIRQIFKKLLETDIQYKSSGRDKGILMETLISEICIKRQNLQ